MSQKPSLVQGTRDFSPLEMSRRRYIFSTVEQVFRSYGFHQIETPAMEQLSTLMGKYGDEGDTLLYKILNSGDFMKKLKEQDKLPESGKALALLAERGLRYDLTVPMARFVVMRQNDITFPFKRYQIQPVWRADRPQKGRYREFYQCDVDIVGSDSLMYEAELLSIYDEVFAKLGLRVSIRLNNRKVLQGVANACGFENEFRAFTTIIDKLDKIGRDEVVKQLQELGGDAEIAMSLLGKGKLTRAFLGGLKAELSDSLALKGIEELETVLDFLGDYPLQNEVVFDGTLARGLNYYTGTIFEVLTLDLSMGSVGGGGRYDDLTGIFGLKGMSGVGVSFGADRIYDALLDLNLYPAHLDFSAEVLFCSMHEGGLKVAFQAATQLRKAAIRCEVYPQVAKFKKQLGYANANQIRYAIILGEDELKSNLFTLKDLNSGEQWTLSVEEIIQHIKTNP